MCNNVIDMISVKLILDLLLKVQKLALTMICSFCFACFMLRMVFFIQNVVVLEEVKVPD